LFTNTPLPINQINHHNVIVWSAPVHATLAQPAAGADALKAEGSARAARARQPLKIPCDFLKTSG
jgi:hypothetical protein